MFCSYMMTSIEAQVKSLEIIKEGVGLFCGYVSGSKNITAKMPGNGWGSNPGLELSDSDFRENIIHATRLKMIQ
jgi:hypothetical protein